MRVKVTLDAERTVDVDVRDSDCPGRPCFEVASWYAGAVLGVLWECRRREESGCPDEEET